MPIHRRAFVSGDRDRMVELLLAYRAAGYATRYPTAWRWQLLLDSRVWDTARDVQLWEDDRGEMAACALLWKRRPDETVYALERVFHPENREVGLPGSVLDWAIDRITAESTEKGESMRLAVLPLEKDEKQDKRLLESRGFARGTGGYNVYMQIVLSRPSAPASLPPGFQLLPLAEDDLERYQATYGFTAVNIEHQQALLHNPEYQHFVIKASDGAFAAYLECSFSRAEWSQHARRVGWVDYVQTQPDYHRQGLARALMLAGFEHLRAQGATRCMLVTSSANAPALALYETVGMDVAGEEYGYVKDIGG